MYKRDVVTFCRGWLHSACTRLLLFLLSLWPLGRQHTALPYPRKIAAT